MKAVDDVHVGIPHDAEQYVDAVISQRRGGSRVEFHTLPGPRASHGRLAGVPASAGDGFASCLSGRRTRRNRPDLWT